MLWVGGEAEYVERVKRQHGIKQHGQNPDSPCPTRTPLSCCQRLPLHCASPLLRLSCASLDLDCAPSAPCTTKREVKAHASLCCSCVVRVANKCKAGVALALAYELSRLFTSGVAAAPRAPAGPGPRVPALSLGGVPRGGGGAGRSEGASEDVNGRPVMKALKLPSRS